MKKLHLVSVLALLLCTAGSASAYDIDDLIRDGRAHHKKAQGLFKDLTVRFEGTMTAPGGGESKISSVHYQKGGLWRDEGEMNTRGVKDMPPGAGKLSTVTVFDGEDIWVLTMGIKTKLGKDQLPMSQSTSPAYWREPVAGSVLLRSEEVNGRDCWVVQAPENPVMKSRPKSWIDKKHFVFVRTETEVSNQIVRTDFSDFRVVKGDFLVPYHYDVYSGGEKTMTGKITDLTINKGLADGLFDPALLGGDQPGLKNMDMDAMMKQVEGLKKQAEKAQKTSGDKDK
jgi:outer membrane lipoprotein-sorting protein